MFCAAAGPSTWGAFGEPDKYGGYVPQRNYFRTVFVTSPTSLQMQDHFNRLMASLTGKTACADHFHKPTKSVQINGGRASAGIYSIMNKLCQIIGQWVVYSKVMEEIRVPLTKLQERLVRLQQIVRLLNI